MECDHSLGEREAACYADDLCPICLQRQLAECQQARTKAIKQFAEEIARLTDK